MSQSNTLAKEGFPIPIGSILPYMGIASKVPPSFVICGGQALKIADYPELYDLIGDTFNTGLVAVGEFLLPALNNIENYIMPNPTLKENASTGALLPPVIHSSDTITIAANQIPPLSAANFSYVYPTYQAADPNNNWAMGTGANQRNFGSRGTFSGGRIAATNSTGSSTPKIVKLNSSAETGGFGSMTSADYQYVNSTPQAIGNIALNDNHSVQYGGMTCLYIMKAYRTYNPSASYNASYSNRAVQQAAYQSGVAAQKAAEGTATTLADQQEDTKAANEAAAIAAQGQGGGTTYPYANVPQLAGFQLPSPPSY